MKLSLSFSDLTFTVDAVTDVLQRLKGRTVRDVAGSLRVLLSVCDHLPTWAALSNHYVCVVPRSNWFHLCDSLQHGMGEGDLAEEVKGKYVQGMSIVYKHCVDIIN